MKEYGPREEFTGYKNVKATNVTTFHFICGTSFRAHQPHGFQLFSVTMDARKRFGGGFSVVWVLVFFFDPVC